MRADVITPAIKSENPGLHAKATVERERIGNVLVVDTDSGYDLKLPDGSTNSEARLAVANATIASLGDNFDFIVVAPAFQINLGEFQGLHWQVSNDVVGIGRPILDLTSQFGSNGRLKAVIDLDESILQSSVTDADYDHLMDTLMHEIMHQWVAYADLQAIVGDASSALTTPTSHWSSKYDSQASVMFGARWQQQSDGRYREVKIRDGYGPLDLYLAGFLPLTELPDTSFLTTNALTGIELPELGRTVSGVMSPVSSSQVIDALGVRIPAAASSQRQFTAALVMLARAGDSISPASVDRLELMRVQAQTRFAAITLGRAGIRIGVLPQSFPGTRGSPNNVSSSLGALPAIDLALATSWLVSRQASTGVWRDKAATTLQDSRRVIDALAADPAAHSQVLAGALQSIATTEGRTTDRISALLQIQGMPEPRRTELLQSLLTSVNADGGWGLADEFSSSTLDTALALRALARADAAHPGTVPVGVISAATDLLSARYRVANQCWSAANADPCDLLTSVAAVQALASVLETGDSAVYAQGLFRWQQASDGFGSGTQATSLETALALNVLQQAGVGDDPRIVAGEAFLAAQQRTDGSWAGSISATAEALLWFQSRERADLRFASAVNVSPQNPVQGQPLNFSFDVQNSGSQPAIATELRIEYRETSQSDWVALPEPGSLPAMLPDQVERISGQWPTVELTAGTYELRVRLDAGDAIPERDELNNTRVAQLALLPAPELPDLTVALNSLQLIPAVITSVPQQVEIRAEIANLGLQPANQVAVAFFGWRFGELRPLGSALCDVPGQSSISLTQLVEIDDLDISRVVVLLDPDNLLIEANESNNQAFALIDRQPTVDLAIDAMDLIVPATPEQGAPTHFLVSVRNLGTRPSPITKLRTEVVHADGTVILLADQQIQLEAAALVQRRVDWTPDREGSATLRASVDFEDLVVETREDNNIAEQSFVIAASTSPNLTLAADSWGISPNPALQGAQISLEIMAVNSSTIAAPAIDVEFLWSDAYGGDFQSIGSVRLAGGLAAGASQQISLQSPTVLAQGSRRLLARIDPQNEVIESNEADNETLYNLPVLSLPNLQLAAVDTQLVPSNPAPGGAATVTTLVRNTGEQAIPQVDIELLWSDGSAAAALQTVSNLAPGTSTSLQFEFTRSVSGGAASLQLIGDRAAVLNEGREDDNSTVIELDSVDPDFVLTETFISPNGDGVQDRTEIVARLSPAQAARIRIVAPWGEEVAVIGDASSPVTTLSGSWDGRRPDGRRALDDRYEVRLEDAAGVPLKLRTVVLDTNRSPLVHAARDGHALVTPLTCAADNGWGTASAEGLDFEIRATQIATQGIGSRGIYRFDFDGSSPQPLLLLSSFAEPTQFTSRNLWLESSGTVAGVVLEDVDGDHLHVISTDSGAAMAPSVLIGPAGVSYLGSLSSGHRIFRGANNELLAVHPDTGTVTNISGSDLIDFDSMTPVVGGAKVIARMQGSAGSSILFKLFGLSVSTTIATELTEFGPAFWSISRPPVEYSLARQAFILSSGPVSAVYDHSFRQQILEISENTGAVEVNADSPQGITNFTVTVSPSGSRILTVRGDNGEARLWDFSTGVAVTIDLAPVRPDPEATLQGFPIGYAVYDFHWSPDESYLAARYGAYQDPDSLEILAENGFLIEARTGELRALGDFRPQAWINGELQLVDGLRGMAIERAFEAWPMLPATSNLSVGQYRPEFTDGRTAVFDTANFQGDCTVHGSQALSSTANGYSNFELEFVPALRSFAITGSALDLNPHDYSLAYQREGESEWSELVSGAANLEDRFLGSWSPPGPGRYTVRLSISDAAGNRVESKRSVVWFESAPIGFVRASEEVISPNGDGVQDRIEVHYELRTPLALAIRVADESGALVRTVNLVHSGPGVYSWQWDGRNESGQVVADGRYRITVYDRSLKVIVDTALPVANVEVLSPGLQACSNLVVSSEWVRSFVPLGEEGGYIRLSGSDSNGPSLSLQQRPRGSTQPWQLMALTAAADGDGRIPKFDINLKPGEISDLEFRAYAIDRGGNSVSIPVQTPGLAITSARLVDGDWINRRSPGDAQCPCDVAVYGASVQPGSIRMGLMAVDPNDWHLEARISRSGGPLSGWNQLPWRMLTMPEDMAEGGDRTKLCFGEREWLVAADIPGFSNGDFARLRFVRSYSGGQLVSNEMKVSSIQGGAGPTPSGLPPGGCGLGYCSRVGGVDAFLPICMEDFDYTVNWPDPRSGNLVPLDVLTSNQPQLQVGLVGLPGGEHRVVARGERPLSSPPFTDIRVSDATVAIDVDGPPRVQIDQPLEGARLCIGGNSDQSRVVATVGEAFLDKVEFYAALSEAIHVDRRSLDVERLLRPDIGGRALASVNPHPFVTQVLPSVGSGPGVVRLTARDCSASTTVERNVFFDSEVSVGRGLVGRDLSALRDPVVLKGGVPFAAFGFAPSLQQELHFALFANESVQASAAVRHLGGRPIQLGLGWDQDWSATGGVIADLGMRSASSGLISWSWDGLDASGNQVVDGEYLVQITLHDDCGHELVRWVPFYLDNHAPDITWIQPEPGESVDLFQPVRAALLDANPLTADLHYRALVGSANWEVIREGFDYGLDPAVQPDPLALWHSDVPAGAYQLRLAARDQVGHVSESTIEVQVPERQPMLAAVDLAPNLISPNDDGVLDQASLQLGFNRGARTTLQLANASGQAVRTLLNDSLASGVLVLDWDGKNDASTVVPDGNYQWILRVVDPAQVLNVEEVALPIAVDNTAPSVVFRAPHGSFSNGRGPLLIDLVEMHPQLLSANSTPAMPGLLAQVDRAGNITLAELDAVPEGVYRIDLLADDLAGNRSSFSHSFTLDRTPPVAGSSRQSRVRC
ncbi:MAG: CARDB domain-containing protein [Lysobacterales bacterium]